MRRSKDNYFHFTRKERNGILVIILLVIVLVTVPFLYPVLFPRTISADKYSAGISKLSLKAEADTRKLRSFNESKNSPGKYTRSVTLFSFDPNTLSYDGWRRLGIKDRTITTIHNYLSKGGEFREAADLKKIWGLQHMAEKLMPFVTIQPLPRKESLATKPIVKMFPVKSYQRVDINVGDSNSLAVLPGIGHKLSQRIIKYRDRLGGFYAPQQVAETFGLPDSTYQKVLPFLSIGESQLRQININTAPIDELKAHPYIRYHLANAIVQYRQQHGNFPSVTALRNIMLVNDSIYKRTEPYLKVE